MAQPGRWHWNRLSFNGAVDVFTANATGTPISTPVPAGAMIGRVQVTTPGATLLSNPAFRVAGAARSRVPSGQGLLSSLGIMRN